MPEFSNMTNMKRSLSDVDSETDDFDDDMKAG